MSIPPSSQPPSTSVPQSIPNPDIDSKIRIYGAVAALRNSRLPTNSQVADALKYAKTNSPVDEKQLFSEGRKLISDIRSILDTLSGYIQAKNDGEIIQRFVWATRGVDTSGLKPSKEDKDKGKTEVTKAKGDAQEAAHHLRTLLRLVLTNAEMRKLLADTSTVGRDLLAKGAAKAAESVAPDPEKLRQADEPAPHDQFVDADPLKKKGPSPTSSSLSDASSSSSDSDDSSPQNGKDTDGKNRLVKKIKSLHASNKSNLDDGRAWLTDEFFPEERRERWIWRGKKVINECQRHADYKESMQWLLDTIEAWATRAQQVGKEEDNTLLPAQTLAEDPSLRSALDLLRTLLERIAGTSLDPVFAAARTLARDAANDEGLRKWWSGVGEYLRKVFLQEGYVTGPACSTRARELRDTGREFYQDKYKGHFETLLDAVAQWFKSLADEPLNKAVAEDFERLTRDLLFDAEGNLQFKKKLWDDVRDVILPTMIDKVGVIPIPRIEYTDNAFDVIVENLTLSGRHLFPSLIQVEARNLLRFSPYGGPTGKGLGNTSQHEVTITFGQIHAAMRDVAFFFRTKTGPIKMQDSGMADVVLGGDGLSATVTVVSANEKDTSSVFRVARVKVNVGSLKFNIRDTKHDLLYKTLKPLATRLVKKQIKKALADAIQTGFEYLDGQLVGVRERMTEGKEDAENRDERKNGSVPLTNTVTSTTSLSSTTNGSSQFKVVASKKQSLMPGTGHPDGWVNRVADKERDIIESGDEWRSDAFDVQPSKESVPTV